MSLQGIFGNMGKILGGGLAQKQVATSEENWICAFTQAASGTVAIGTKTFGAITRFAGGVNAIATGTTPNFMPITQSASIVDIYTPSGTVVAGTDFVFDITVNDIPQKIGFSAIAGNVANGAGRAKLLKPFTIPPGHPYQPTAYTALATFTGASQVQNFIVRVLVTPTK